MAEAGRIASPAFAAKVMGADDAAALIDDGTRIGMSGFTGAGSPKAVPGALARRIADAHRRGDRFTVSVSTGASTGPDLDGALSATEGIEPRMPYQSDPVTREEINAGRMDYVDVHLSHVAQMVWEGFFGHLDVAVVEVAGIAADGALVPSSSVQRGQRRTGRPRRRALRPPHRLHGGHPGEISNHPEVVRRLGVLAMTGWSRPTSTGTSIRPTCSARAS